MTLPLVGALVLINSSGQSQQAHERDRVRATLHELANDRYPYFRWKPEFTRLAESKGHLLLDLALGPKRDETVRQYLRSCVSNLYILPQHGSWNDEDKRWRTAFVRAIMAYPWTSGPTDTMWFYALFAGKTLRLLGPGVLEAELEANKDSMFAFCTAISVWDARTFPFWRPHLDSSDTWWRTNAFKALRRWAQGGVKLNFDQALKSKLEKVQGDAKERGVIRENARLALTALKANGIGY